MKNLILALRIFFGLTIITGMLYPLSLTLFAQIFFKDKANGSMITNNGKVIGSELIGQKFISPEFFWGRPSAINYNPFPSGAGNMNPIGDKLKTTIQERIDSIQKYHLNTDMQTIPKDLLFASGSGVDPHISSEACYFQFERVSKFRKLDENQKKKLLKLIKSSIETNDLIIGGQAKVNVLKLNLKLLEI